MHGTRVAGVVALAATALMPVAAQEPTPAGPTPAAIIEKHLGAIGGREALRAVKTMVVLGRNAGLGAADRPLIRYLKHPNLLRQQDAPGASTFIVSDGSKVHQVGGSGAVEVTQAWASPLRHTTIDDGFLDDGKLGTRYEYLGTDTIKTGPWKFHHLKRMFRDGYTEDLYFEAESGLLRMRIEDNGRAKRVYYDYRDVGGIRCPIVTATIFDGLEPPHLFIVDEIRLNVALDDTLFLRRDDCGNVEDGGEAALRAIQGDARAWAHVAPTDAAAAQIQWTVAGSWRLSDSATWSATPRARPGTAASSRAIPLPTSAVAR